MNKFFIQRKQCKLKKDHWNELHVCQVATRQYREKFFQQKWARNESIAVTSFLSYSQIILYTKTTLRTFARILKIFALTAVLFFFSCVTTRITPLIIDYTMNSGWTGSYKQVVRGKVAVGWFDLKFNLVIVNPIVKIYFPATQIWFCVLNNSYMIICIE